MGELDGEAWGISDVAALISEIDRDLGERAALSAELVRKGRVSQAEADYVAAVVGDIRADLLFAFSPMDNRETWQRPDPAVSWNDKCRWLRGELELRRKTYPELVAKGRMTEADAKQRGRAVAALHRLYWERMFQWLPPEGPAREYLDALRAAAELRSSGKPARRELRSGDGAKIYRELVRRHMAEVEAANDPGQGSLLPEARSAQA